MSHAFLSTGLLPADITCHPVSGNSQNGFFSPPEAWICLRDNCSHGYAVTREMLMDQLLKMLQTTLVEADKAINLSVHVNCTLSP